MKETFWFRVRAFGVHSADRITSVSLGSWDKRAGYLKKVTSLFSLCCLCLAGTLSAQQPTASWGALSANSIRDILSPQGNCGASSLPFADPTTRALWQQVLKARSAPGPAALMNRFLPAMIGGVDATSPVVVNEILNTGNIISGAVFFTVQEKPNSITAWDMAGNSFQGVFDPATNTYGIVVSPGTYTLTACYSELVGPFMLPGPTFGFNDPAQIDATLGDVNHDVTLPDTPPVVQVQGNVVGADASKSNSVTFVSPDGNAAASTILDPSGSYGGNPFLPFALPPGNYTVALNQTSTAPPINSSTFVLGPVTVSGPGTLPDLTKPPTTTLSGTAVMADGTPDPANTFVLATQVVTPPPTSWSCYSLPVNNGFASADPSTGAFTMELAPATYGPQAAIPFFAADPSTGQSQGTILVTAPNVVVAGPTTVSINTPPVPPGMSNISGQVTDGIGTAISNVGVAAFAQFDPSAIFARSNTTGSTGQYAITVIPSAPFGLSYVPSN